MSEKGQDPNQAPNKDGHDDDMSLSSTRSGSVDAIPREADSLAVDARVLSSTSARANPVSPSVQQARLEGVVRREGDDPIDDVHRVEGVAPVDRVAQPEGALKGGVTWLKGAASEDGVAQPQGATPIDGVARLPIQPEGNERPTKNSHSLNNDNDAQRQAAETSSSPEMTIIASRSESDREEMSLGIPVEDEIFSGKVQVNKRLMNALYNGNNATMAEVIFDAMNHQVDRTDLTQDSSNVRNVLCHPAPVAVGDDPLTHNDLRMEGTGVNPPQFVLVPVSSSVRSNDEDACDDHKEEDELVEEGSLENGEESVQEDGELTREEEELTYVEVEEEWEQKNEEESVASTKQDEGSAAHEPQRAQEDSDLSEAAVGLDHFGKGFVTYFTETPKGE
eukprot:CAMPEP_0116865664 /NCGR_PEP_ID=MMETSP0418-20121206/25585_1 /TAXON_ID=1158023 /ORGANISM="Astrosyne radiata, Strain 13vi08-1A" /LENGTH=391 /DNA_ID=CAMNT_0004501185 /DNA_START=245 /DNA_END=1420 /DNA_ORIENTATION=+